MFTQNRLLLFIAFCLMLGVISASMNLKKISDVQRVLIKHQQILEAIEHNGRGRSE